MAKSYEELMQQSFDELPDEKLLPNGSWLLRGRNGSFQKPTSPDQNPSFIFVYQAKEHMDDVDPAALEALGDYDIGANDIFAKFWIEKPKHLKAVKHHLEQHGIVIDTTIPIMEALAKGTKEFKGTEVIAYLTTRTFQNREGQVDTENKPSNFTPVPA